jgi:hypothetical protein
VTADRFQPQPCPNVAVHADMPDGYAARSAWMAEKARTHVQSRCGGCGQWVVWTAREGVGGGNAG